MSLIKLQSIAGQIDEAAEMEELLTGDISRVDGLLGDLSGKRPKGEIAVLSKDSWVKACQETGNELPGMAGSFARSCAAGISRPGDDVEIMG